ncbi:MAG: hypothetical protein ACX94B_02935 [Henriciella sp.]|nr:hypothetical protein [Hyphomonadaceae bacterium]
MSVLFPAAAAARLDDKQERAKRQNGRGPRRRGNLMRLVMSAFPLFIIPVGIYCLIALTTSGDPTTLTHGTQVLSEKASPLMGVLGQKFFAIGMIGGEIEWVLTKGDALLLLSIAVLFMEILKSTSTGTATIMNHALSMIVFIVCLMLFLLHPNFATSVFFILTVMALLDVLAGVVVTIVSARRDFGVGEGFVG